MDCYSAVLVCLLVSCAAQNALGVSNSAETLRILALLPYPNPAPEFRPTWDGGRDIVPALDLAAQHVNQREGFLDGYELELIHRDGGCNIPTTLFSGLVSGLFVNSEKSVVGLLGPGCSASTLGLLSTVGTENRTSFIAVHGAGSPNVNRASFPNSFGTLGSSFGYVEVTYALMRRSGWRNIAVLLDPRRAFFRDTVQDLMDTRESLLTDANILFSISIYSFYIPLEELGESLARVVFVFASVDLSKQIMCLALRSGMLYPDYQWVFVGRTIEDFTGGEIVFDYDGLAYNCSMEEITTVALNNSLFVNYKLVPFEQDTATRSGFSYREYLEQYSNQVMNHNSEPGNDQLSVSIWATYFYDAVWAWAVVLDNVTKSGNFSIEEYQFDQPNDALIEQFEQVDFEGVSGRIKFDRESGSVDRVIDIFQVLNGSVEYVAYSKSGVIFNLTDSIVFIQDQFRISEEDKTVDTWLAVLALAVTFCITLILIALEIVTVVNKDFRSIKASSPKINHLAYCGCYFLMIAFLLYTIEEAWAMNDVHNGRLCHALWAIFFPFGFTLAFGAVGVRTWRLYRIFNHYLNPGRFISEKALFIIVFLLLGVDVVIAVVWTAIDPFVVGVRMESRMTNDGLGRLFLIRRDCTSRYYFYWFAIVYVYRFIELGAVFILALLTRNIRNKSFETKRLQGLIYGMTMAFVFGFALYLFVLMQSDVDNHSFVVLAIVVNTMVLLYLGCIFAPPVYPLLKEKLKERGIDISVKSRRLRKTSGAAAFVIANNETYTQDHW